jgi:hypothetical protein
LGKRKGKILTNVVKACKQSGEFNVVNHRSCQKLREKTNYKITYKTTGSLSVHS